MCLIYKPSITHKICVTVFHNPSITSYNTMGVGNTIKISANFGKGTKALGGSPVNQPNYFYGPQLVVNSDGKSLDVSISDKTSVGSFPFHGHVNQQWVIQEDGDGGAALLSVYHKTYLAPQNQAVDSPLTSTDVPYYWKISQDAGGYMFAVPNLDLGLLMGNNVVVRPLSEVKPVYVLGNTPENQDSIKGGKISQSKPATPNKRSGSLPSSNITIKLNDLSLSGNMGNRIKELEKHLSHDKNNLVIVGNQQTGGSQISGSPHRSLASEPSAGFPNGYFRIRAPGTPFYLTPRGYETQQDGNGIALATLNAASESQVFFINSKGNLCCGTGVDIDVVGNTLIVAQGRPAIQAEPNPWSHPLPTFSYSKDTKSIRVKPYIDPVVSAQWPRAETEWKDKDYMLAARSLLPLQVPAFQLFSKWAPTSPRAAGRWTTRAGSRVEARDATNLGVEIQMPTMTSADLDRFKWDIELV